MFFMFLWVGSQKLISMGLEDGSVGKVHAGWAREWMNTQESQRPGKCQVGVAVHLYLRSWGRGFLEQAG